MLERLADGSHVDPEDRKVTIKLKVKNPGAFDSATGFPRNHNPIEEAARETVRVEDASIGAATFRNVIMKWIFALILISGGILIVVGALTRGCNARRLLCCGIVLVVASPLILQKFRLEPTSINFHTFALINFFPVARHYSSCLW